MNGSFEAAQSTGIVLAGDASEVLKPDVGNALEGLGMPPLRELMAKARANAIPVFV